MKGQKKRANEKQQKTKQKTYKKEEVEEVGAFPTDYTIYYFLSYCTFPCEMTVVRESR